MTAGWSVHHHTVTRGNNSRHQLRSWFAWRLGPESSTPCLVHQPPDDQVLHPAGLRKWSLSNDFLRVLILHFCFIFTPPLRSISLHRSRQLEVVVVRHPRALTPPFFLIHSTWRFLCSCQCQTFDILTRAFLGPHARPAEGTHTITVRRTALSLLRQGRLVGGRAPPACSAELPRVCEWGGNGDEDMPETDDIIHHHTPTSHTNQPGRCTQCIVHSIVHKTPCRPPRHPSPPPQHPHTHTHP